MSVTIKDIAARVGMAFSTVSAALNDSPKVNAQTKKIILKAAKDMHYHANLSARNLMEGKTNIFAVITPAFSSLFEIEIMKGISLGLNSNKYSVSRYSTHGEFADQEEMLRAILYGKRADAVIMINLKPGQKTLDEFVANNVPMVLIENKMNGAYSVMCDGRAGVFAAVKYLVKSGNKKIGCVAIDSHQLADDWIRIQTFREAIEENGHKFSESLIYLTDDAGLENGEKALSYFLQKEHRVDAVFCAAGDTVAMGMMEAAKRRNIKIPRDMAIIGYDDIFCAALMPVPLTTVRQPIINMGIEAVKMAADAVEGMGYYDKDRPVIFNTELILRSSA